MLTDVQYAINQLRLAQKASNPADPWLAITVGADCTQRALDALERVEEALQASTPTEEADESRQAREDAYNADDFARDYPNGEPERIPSTPHCEHEWHYYGLVNGQPDVGCQKCGATRQQHT